MGLYSEVIKKREAQDRRAAQISEMYLVGEASDGYTGSESVTEDVMAALEYIFMEFRIKTKQGNNCKTVNELLSCTLENAGMLYETINVSEGIKNSNKDHILAFTDDGSAVVISPSLFRQHYYIPRSNIKGIYNRSFRLQPKAYVISRPIPAENFSIRSFAVYVMKIISARDWMKVAAVSLLFSLLGVVIPEISRAALGTYTKYAADDAVLLLVIASLGLFLIYFLRAVFSYIKSVLIAAVSLDVVKKTEAAFMTRILLLPMSFFGKNTSGKISANVSFSKELATLVVSLIVNASLTAFFSIAYLGEINHISTGMLWIALGILLIKIVINIISNILHISNEKQRLESESELIEFNFMGFKGINKIKLAGAENRFYKDWAWLLRSNLKYTYEPPTLLKIKMALSLCISAAATIAFLLVAQSLKLPASDYFAFISIYGMLDITFEQIFLLCEKAAVARSYIDRLKPIMDAACVKEDPNRTYVNNRVGNVRFENIGLHYDENDQFRLDDISLTVRTGEKIAFVGYSGCGKSSLVNLITGINVPDAGEIYIDGKPLSRMNQRSLNRRIGSVSQFSRLFPGTIRFNVNIGNDDITDEMIWEALDHAQIGDTIRKYPLGLDTEISAGQHGGFSGGQMQRILLARAFAGQYGIIILDEATSALDTITQRKVLEHVYAMDATVIMVAHRLSTVKKCDRIIVIDNGAIAESGNYEELISRRGIFHELVEKQLRTGENSQDEQLY